MKDFQNYLDRELANVRFDDTAQDDNDCASVEQLLAQQIILARKQLHISQSLLSKRTGIQQSSLSKIENGDGNPSIQTLQRIANGLGKKLIIILE